ncbi:MAG: hypothetical protein H0U49_07140 [Parachlamydiaceae bacterium]|nr:hypothetical protein [Parachlamydiaceae bacterium]
MLAKLILSLGLINIEVLMKILPIITLTLKPGAGRVDHCFASSTYTEPLKTNIDKFIATYGESQ